MHAVACKVSHCLGFPGIVLVRYVHTLICTYIFMYVVTCTYIQCMYMYIHTHIHTYMHTYIHTYTHTFIHTYMHTRMHTHTCNIIYCMVSLTIGEFKVKELRGRLDRARWCPVCRRHVVALPARTSAAAVVPLGSLPAKQYQCHVEMLLALRPLHRVVTPPSPLAAWPSLRLVAGEN